MIDTTYSIPQVPLPKTPSVKNALPEGHQPTPIRSLSTPLSRPLNHHIQSLYGTASLQEAKVKLLGDVHSDPEMVKWRQQFIEEASILSGIAPKKRIFLVEGIQSGMNAYRTRSDERFLGDRYIPGKNCHGIAGCDDCQTGYSQAQVLRRLIPLREKRQDIQKEIDLINAKITYAKCVEENEENVTEKVDQAELEDQLRALETKFTKVEAKIHPDQQLFSALTAQRTKKMVETIRIVHQLAPDADIYVAAGIDHLVDPQVHQALSKAKIPFVGVCFHPSSKTDYSLDAARLLAGLSKRGNGARSSPTLSPKNCSPDNTQAP